MSAPTPVGFQIAGDPAQWEDLGFLIDSAGRCEIGSVVLSIGQSMPPMPPGIVGWALAPATGDGPVDGIATTRLGELPGRGARWPHPIGATSVDHVVVASADWWRTVGAMQATGMALKRERDAGTPETPVKQGFFRHGECVVEVVGPPDPSPEGGSARLWGLTLTVADLDVTAELLGDRLGSVRDAVQPGRRIATVRRELGLGVPLALMSPER